MPRIQTLENIPKYMFQEIFKGRFAFIFATINNQSATIVMNNIASVERNFFMQPCTGRDQYFNTNFQSI